MAELSVNMTGVAGLATSTLRNKLFYNYFVIVGKEFLYMVQRADKLLADWLVN